MHYYIYRKIAPLLPAAHIFLGIAFALLVVSPIATRVLINMDWLRASRVVAGIGYTWMGFAFLFFSFALIVDAARGVLWLIGKAARSSTLSLPWLSSTHATVTMLFIALLACVYGAYSAKQINIKRINFPTAKFTDGHAVFRIVQITDLHLGVLTSEKRILRMVEEINNLHPDIVVSTGDLVDAQADHIDKFAGILRQLHARYGRYAVTGNHESISGIEDALKFTKDAGFTVLSSEGRVVDKMVNIVGVDDPMVIRRMEKKPSGETSILQQFNNGLVTILLKHQPVIDKTSIPYFNLQLSGHIHGGQIFPFGFFAWLSYHVRMGLSQVAPSSWLYVSYGSGTWGPPIRFLAPSEVTVINIVPLHGNE